MSYRKIKPVLIDLDNLCQECGLFYVDNNVTKGGSCCSSKSKDKQESGCCYSWDCPLARNASIEDLKEHDPILYEEYKDNVEEECGNWLIQYRECVR
jgi:hypothetical protein